MPQITYLMYPTIRNILLACLVCFTTMATAQNTQDVLVIEEEAEAPANTKFLGKIKVGDGGFKINCGYERVMDEAKEKVIKKGGNILKITKLKEPSVLGSTCYRVWGEAYYTDSLESLMGAIMQDKVTPMLISDTAKYALLYIYRPHSSVGGLLNYWLHVNDEEVCRVRNYSSCVVKIEKEGPVKLWGTIETRAEKELDIRFGQVYFIRCEIGMGVWVGRPVITIQHPNKGYYEYSLISN